MAPSSCLQQQRSAEPSLRMQICISNPPITQLARLEGGVDKGCASMPLSPTSSKQEPQGIQFNSASPRKNLRPSTVLRQPPAHSLLISPLLLLLYGLFVLFVLVVFLESPWGLLKILLQGLSMVTVIDNHSHSHSSVFERKLLSPGTHMWPPSFQYSVSSPYWTLQQRSSLAPHPIMTTQTLGRRGEETRNMRISVVKCVMCYVALDISVCRSVMNHSCY